MLTARGRGTHAISALPLAYFALAHVSLAIGLAILAIDPALPGAFFYHPRMIAVVHLLTLGWITASILGAFYIVAPLALNAQVPVRRRDWIGFAAFWIGAAGMVSHFWLGTYDGMAWSAGLVLAAIANVAPRGCHGIPETMPRAVRLHVRLAFTNILLAGLIGIIAGIDKSRGVLGISPLAATYAHAHLAALGWGAMMVMGLAYRLMPMMLPATPPSGRLPIWSAYLVQAGVLLLIPALVLDWPLLGVAAFCMVGGLCVFAFVIMKTGLARLPRPPALPARDWSIWQVHASFIWLLLAVMLGVALARADAIRLPAYWVYGVAGLAGFLGQIIAGMLGRLVPFYAWYRAAAATIARPKRSAHALVEPRLTATVFWTWNVALPVLAVGLALERLLFIRAGSVLLLCGIAAGAWHTVLMLTRARGAMKKENSDDHAGTGVPLQIAARTR